MKKIIVLLSIGVLLVTGCSAKKLDDTDIGSNISFLLSDETKLYNTYFDGFKYYVPKGLKLVNKDSYNAVFMDGNSNRYYLYVDAISYYHKTENTYMVNKNIHYSNKLNYNGKSGYIDIEKINDKFFIQFVFNYAKMEACVSERDLTSVINNMCYVLRTVKFNDLVLESLIGENALNYKEENFQLFKKDKKNTNVLNVVDDGYNINHDKSHFVDDENIELIED